MKQKLIITLFLFALFSISCSNYKVVGSQKRFLLNNSGKNKYYLIEYIKQNKAENTLGEVPTLMIHKIDGDLIIRSDKEYSKNLDLKKQDIKRIEIISSEKASKIYGSAGKNGVINIYTYGKSSNS